MSPVDKGAPTNPTPESAAPATGVHAAADAKLLSALAGLDAAQSREAAIHTRRVVTGSAANLRQRRLSSGRSRNLAIAGVVLVLLLITPLIWSSVDSLMGDQHITDTASELSLLGLLVGSTLIAAMLVAGWLRNRR